MVPNNIIDPGNSGPFNAIYAKHLKNALFNII